MLAGGLFTREFLHEGIKETDAWKRLDANALASILARTKKAFTEFPTMGNPTEAETEKDLIWPVLEAIGWGSDNLLVQQKMSVTRRGQVPDGLLVADARAKAKAKAIPEADAWKRLHHGLCLVESKRWQRTLD